MTLPLKQKVIRRLIEAAVLNPAEPRSEGSVGQGTHHARQHSSLSGDSAIQDRHAD